MTAVLWARPPVWRIALAGAASAAAGLTLLRVQAALPITSQISVWQPASLFGDGLLLTVDTLAWPTAFMLALLPLVCLLSRIGARPLEGPETTTVLAMAGFGLAALSASNLLTLMVVWSLMGVCRVGWAILAGTPEQGPPALVRVVAQEIAAPLLLLLAGFLDQMAGGGASLLAPMQHPVGAVVFLLAVLVRAAPVGAFGNEWSAPGRGLVGTLAFQGVPAAVALASLGRLMLNGLPPGAYVWGSWLGLLAVLSGLPGWLRDPGRNAGGLRLAWAMAGTGVLAACLTRSGEAALAAGTLLLLLAGLHALRPMQRPWQQVWPALGILAATGAPALPGAGLAMPLGRLMQSGLGGWMVVAVAMAGIAAGLWLRDAYAPAEADAPAGAAVGGADLASLALLLSAGLVSLRQGWLGNPASLALTAGITALGIAIIVLATRLPQSEFQQSRAPLSEGLVRLGSEFAQVCLGAAGQLVGGVAGLFEGRAGMLWMFLVVLAAWLALRV